MFVVKSFWATNSVTATQRSKINMINIEVLRRVSQNMVERVHLCLAEEGGHFQHLM